MMALNTSMGGRKKRSHLFSPGYKVTWSLGATLRIDKWDYALLSSPVYLCYDISRGICHYLILISEEQKDNTLAFLMVQSSSQAEPRLSDI